MSENKSINGSIKFEGTGLHKLLTGKLTNAEAKIASQLYEAFPEVVSSEDLVGIETVGHQGYRLIWTIKS